MVCYLLFGMYHRLLGALFGLFVFSMEWLRCGGNGHLVSGTRVAGG